MKKILLLLVGLLVVDLALAETRYVTDQFTITLRRGQTTGHRIARMLPSGTPVEVLGTDAKTGYSHVRLAGGTDGYVLSHQLQDEPTARERLAAAEAKLAELQQAPDQLTTQLGNLRTQYETLRVDYEQIKTEKQRIEQDLATVKHTSANAVRIAEERNELRTAVATLTRQAEELKQQNRDFENRDAQYWFLIGAGVLMAGIGMGLILPHLRFQRRKTSWGSL